MLGDFVGARKHADDAIARYDPAQYRPLATRFGQDPVVTTLSYRSWVLWFLGYPKAALVDADQALKNAHAIGHAATSMVALSHASAARRYCGDYATANTLIDELAAVADEKDAVFSKATAMANRGQLYALTGKFSDALPLLTSGLKAMRATGATFFLPNYVTFKAMAHSELGQFSDAWRCIDEAKNIIETTKGTIAEAEVNRVAGEIALLSAELDAAKAEGYFQRALAVARQQQAKSWELRAAMSLARLWRDQDKVQQARELLAPVYGWFTEGFDTRDLKEAKALLEELGS